MEKGWLSQARKMLAIQETVLSVKGVEFSGVTWPHNVRLMVIQKQRSGMTLETGKLENMNQSSGVCRLERKFSSLRNFHIYCMAPKNNPQIVSSLFLISATNHEIEVTSSYPF